MSVYQKVTADFYNGIAAGDIEVVEALIDDDFELIVPMSSGVLSGIYKGKKRFLEGVIPLVFSCVDPEQMIFCKNFKIISIFDNMVIAMAQNDGIALSGKPYNQTYFHIMTIVSGKITRLIESFDSALANEALWMENTEDLRPDIPFSLDKMDSNI